MLCDVKHEDCHVSFLLPLLFATSTVIAVCSTIIVVCNTSIKLHHLHQTSIPNTSSLIDSIPNSGSLIDSFKVLWFLNNLKWGR
ncbi:hypothetical protein L6452_41961 [Arctium lappa]|uniref:Uncharacterized protein n=1 Tax=Arctium lappa TaxID=4217 RepID=A0ACB8XGH3_ARCLA|nr:hypothetical protein L6452_41961 [Arctium lappa]